MNEPRWLSTQEQATWRAFLRAHRMLMRDLDRRLRDEVGLSHATYRFLVRLADRPGGSARLTELAFDADHSQSRTSHAVARIERDGLVRREPDSRDARVVNVVLTEAGRQALRAAAPGHVRRVREVLFDEVDPMQLRVFNDVLDGMVERLGEGDV